MSEPKELSRKDLFYSLLFKLGVAYNYEKAKLKREDIYAIQVENKKVNIRPIKFLKQLFSLDYHCRNTIYEDRNDSNMKNETNYDSEEDLFSNKKVSQASKVTSTSEDVVSSSDLILCTLAICDNFLIQDVFEKMISCQLAVPLIAPIGDHLVFHLWATRTIRKKWVNTLPDASQKTLEGIITNKDMTTISFCRIGETKVSKSKLANTFLSSGQGWPEHSYFLHKDIDSKPKLTNGSIEAIWYCPEGRERENLKNISLIYNLRGNVRKNRKQFAFLLKVSSVLVILMETNDMTSKEIDFFNKAENCHKVLIDFSKTGLPVSKGTKTVIFAAGMNFQALSESISKCIGFIKGNQMSLEAQALFAEKLDMKIDEDEDDGCLRAKHAAKAFIEDIKNYDIEIVKENVVPLQGKLWQDWAKLDKEESRHQFRGATDTQVYSDSLREQKEHLRELQYQTGPSKEVLNFIEEIQNKESRAYFLHWCQMELNEMSERYLPSLLKEYNRSTQNLSALLKKQEGGNTDKNSISDEIKNEKEYLKRLSESFIVASFGIEHIFREFSQIYESCEKHKKNKTARILPKLMAELFLMGQPLEIMDGDTSHIPLDWVMAVFFELKKLLGSATRVFVLSILGIQSSGKSTLLNTLFGSKFAVSSGRCTKGVYLQMLPVKNEYREKMNCDYFIIMDSEGLRSPELAGSFRHDNEIATLVACLANTTIVNFWGQTFSKDMADIMQIIAHAYIRMKEVEIKSSFHLIFAGVQDVTAEERNKLGVSRVMDELNEMILKAARNESCKENLNGLSSIFPLLSVKLEATKIPEFLPTLWQGSMSPPESRYGEITDQIKNSLCKGLTIKQSTGIQSQPLKEFSDRLCNVWEAIKIENFIFGFKNTQAIETFADLQKFYDQEIGKVRSAFYQLSWKIGEASLQEAHLSKDEHQSFKNYCNQIEKQMSPKIALWQEDFDNKFRTFVTQLPDPETASNYMSAFSIDLFQKMQGWHDNERKEIQYKISTICKKEKTAPMKRDEYRKNFVKKAQELAQDLKGGRGICLLEQGAINDAFTCIFNQYLDQAKSEEVGMTENLRTLFQKIWQESKEHLILKLKNFRPKSNAALNFDIELCYKFVQESNTDNALYDIPYNPKDHLFHHLKFRTFLSKEVANLTCNQLNLIICKLKEDIEKCREGNVSYFNYAASIAQILENVHNNITNADLRGWKYDKLFVKDFLIRAFGILVKKMEILEKENLMKYSLVALLQSERQVLFEEFKKECQTANDDVVAAIRFVDDTLSSILVSQIKVSVGSQVFNAILTTEKFNQKNSMMYFLMKKLLDAPFESFILYVQDYEKFMQKWFQCALIEFCNLDQFLLQSIKQKLQSTIAELKTILRSFAEKKIHKIRDKNVWWVNLKAELEQNGFIFQESDQHAQQSLVGTQDLAYFTSEVIQTINEKGFDLKILGRVIASASGELIYLNEDNNLELNDILVKDLLAWFVDKPLEALSEQRLGCTAQCPFCGAVCGGSISCRSEGQRVATNQRHRVELHMPRGFNGFRYDQENNSDRHKRLVVKVCTSSVCSDKERFRFGDERKKEKYNIDHDNFIYYKEVPALIYDWHIQPSPQANATAYWQHLFVKHQVKLAEYYGAKEANDIPPGWYNVTKKDAIKNLRDLYRIQEEDNSSDEEEEECVICKSCPKGNFCFSPCGHANACQRCADILMQRRDRCPTCRGQIERTQPIFR